MSNKKGTSAWIWIGCGCFLCVALVVAAIGGVGFAGFSWVKNLVEDMADPQARTAATLDMLGAETLPPGYHARAFFSIPFLLQMAILSDGEPPPPVEAGESFDEKAEQLKNLTLESDQMGENTLIYLKVRDRDPSDPIEDVLAGRGRSGADIDLGVEFDAAHALGEGERRVEGRLESWRSFHGEMDATGGDHSGVYAAIQVQCDDGEVHDLLWFQQQSVDTPSAEAPSAETPSEADGVPTVDLGPEDLGPEDLGPEDLGPDDLGPTEVPTWSAEDLVGTPADPEALAELLSYFDLCR